MEHSLQKPSLNWSMSTNKYSEPMWTFWSIRPNDEFEYQRKKMAAPVVPSYPGIDKDTIQSIFETSSILDFCLIQFWSPVKVNGLTFLSTADQPFLLCGHFDKRICTYRRHCLDALIPVDIDDANGEALPGPPARAFVRGFPEFCLDIQSYSAVEFPLLQHAIQCGIQSYCAIPVFKLPEKHCLGVVEIASTCEYLYYPYISKDLDLGSSPYWPMDIRPKLSEWWEVARDQIEEALDVVHERHSLPFAQIWIPDSESNSIKALISTGRISHHAPSYYGDFVCTSAFSYIQSGKGVVGRAFSSQETCFCKDVTLLRLLEYPLVPSARKAGLTECFAICLRSKSLAHFVCVVECFLPHNEMVDRGAKTFLNILLSTMKEQLPGFIVASGKELGQRMVVEVVKASPSDELDSFEIGHSLPSVQSLQDGEETTEIYSLGQKSNLQHVRTMLLLNNLFLVLHLGLTHSTVSAQCKLILLH